MTMATAKKLPSGSWRIQPCKTLADGTKLRTSITAPTKKEAELLAIQWQVEQEQHSSENLTLGDALDEYLKTLEKTGSSPTTLREYKSRRKTAFPLLENCMVRKITPAMIQKNIDKRLETVSLKTVRNDFYFLRPVLALYAPDLPLNRIKLGRQQKRKKIHMKESWKYEIPRQCAAMFGKQDFYLYILFMIFAGLRPSEAYGLTWADISPTPTTRLWQGEQFEVGYITVNKATVRTDDNGFATKAPKTHAGVRTFELDWSFFAELYAARPRGANSEKIFHQNPYCNHRKWRNLQKAMGLPTELRQYDLRHYYATDVAYSGASEEELMERMGHSTAAFSHSVYVEIFEERQNALNAVLSHRTADAIKHLTDSEKSLRMAKTGVSEQSTHTETHTNAK